MTKTTKPARPSRASLKNSLAVQTAQDIGATAAAHRDIDGATTNRYMASGLILQLTNLSGKVVVGPVMIVDGLSPDTIAAIKADIKRSHDYRLTMNQLK